jgi:hypothetical protein
MALYRFWVNRRFGGTYRLHLQGREIREMGPSVIFSTMKIQVIRSSETSVNPGSTQRHIPEDDILHSHHYENLKWYKQTQDYFNILTTYIHSMNKDFVSYSVMHAVYPESWFLLFLISSSTWMSYFSSNPLIYDIWRYTSLQRRGVLKKYQN